MDRRGFLKGILAACVAPYVVTTSGVLMPIRRVLADPVQELVIAKDLKAATTANSWRGDVWIDRTTGGYVWVDRPRQVDLTRYAPVTVRSQYETALLKPQGARPKYGPMP